MADASVRGLLRGGEKGDIRTDRLERDERYGFGLSERGI